MWRLFALAKTPKEGNNTNSTQRSAAQLRVIKDLEELSLPDTCSTEFPDADDLLNFCVIIRPDEGYYRGGTFRFAFHIGDEYPHVAPKIKCLTKIFHPNIDLEGNVCLNILRDDWKPVLSINSIVYGLQHLLLEPNADDPLNKDAADLLRVDPKKFANMAYYSMRSGSSSKSKLLGKSSSK